MATVCLQSLTWTQFAVTDLGSICSEGMAARQPLSAVHLLDSLIDEALLDRSGLFVTDILLVPLLDLMVPLV